MLYIWPLFAFFSAPLFIPQLLDWSVSIFQPLIGPTTSAVPSKKTPSTKGSPKPNQSTALQTFNWLGSCRKIHSIAVLAGALGAATLIVRYNTIIHPFTLADNRHYMFYVFRYTILKAWWIRYALVPAYIVCGWLCWAALRGGSSSSSSSPAEYPNVTPFGTSEAVPPPPAGEKQPTSNSNSSPAYWNLDAATSPPTSTVLVLVLASALSLVTAPLVEPRYFILPWVFWRLLVPAASVRGSKSPASRRLLVCVLETAWFVLINAATMYVFITRPFYWRAPDGALLDGGRVQRFMW